MPDFYPISRVIGHKITYHRKMKGMSLTDLSKVIGVSEQQQSRYERGINRINLDKLNKYAKVFNIKLSSFFILDDKESDEINAYFLSEVKNIQK
ncbi:helix-turn-helix domain-containing protein [Providencia sp.]|uniref:helix-turn-helix domain-containing protein n=1 Tax=Providencia sp. TaxID=589 RepID=UPI000E854586|nr:helix-turn-helix transcriptional regulator [Providencia sp.]HBO23476.1 XRE family transcriptional regulator [Providencia sp.]